jgi:hypothetical protein
MTARSGRSTAGPWQRLLPAIDALMAAAGYSVVQPVWPEQQREVS